MIILAASKLMTNPEMRNLKFNEGDFLELIYKK